MPLINMDDRGTENDGSKSKEYCKYCYSNGRFVDPQMTLELMKFIVGWKMQSKQLPMDVIQKNIKNLRYLKRWINVRSTANEGLRLCSYESN